MSRYIDADKLNFSRIRIMHPDGTIGGYNAVVMSAEINNAPTADVEEVRHGKWIPQSSMDDRYSRYYICSVCGRLEQVSHAYDIKTFSPYCHCGAKMDKEKEKWQNLK